MDDAAAAEVDDIQTDGPPSRPHRPLWRRALTVVLPSAIAIALLVGVLPAMADLAEVWSTIVALEPAEVGLLVLLAAWNILTYQFVIMAALPGVSLSQAFIVGQISTAVSNTVPAGSAVGIGVTYALFASFGHSATAIGIAAALTGLWNTFVKLGLPVVALALLAFRGNPNPAMLGAAMTGLVVLAMAITVLGVVVASDRLAVAAGIRLGEATTRVARPFGRGPFEDWGERFHRFRVSTSHVLARRWSWLTATTLLSHLSLFAMMLASLRVMGVGPTEVGWDEALAAFSFVRLVTALPITPGGIGLVEVGLTGALTLAGGGQAQIVAAVLVFRALSYGAQIPIGAISWLAWKTRMGRQPVT
jgi:uncharacterized membrane protein YbhN (UPF0104 family)